MNRADSIVSLLLAAIVVAGCSSTPNEPDYKNSPITPTLDMPPNILAPTSARNLGLSGSKVGLESNTGRFVETGNMQVGKSVAPKKLGKIKVAGEGDLHWLTIASPVEEVFPVLREFWLSEGFELSRDEPIVGVLKTQWMSSRAGNASSFFGSLLESMRAADSKHQYTTRVQRENDDSGTRIFIAHRAQEQIIREDDADITADDRQGWQFSPADPAREAEMLSRLMLFLGMRDDAAQAELTKIGGFAPRASLVRATSAQDGDTESFLPPDGSDLAAANSNDDDEGIQLAVTQSFERTWNRLRHQLDRYGIEVEDAQRSQRSLEGKLAVNSASFASALQQSVPTKRSQLVFSLQGHDNADFTYIGLLDDSGSEDKTDTAYRVLESLLPLLK